ncbi:MAG: hypothetical protein FJ194_11550 [Gammaproteobacteria bacterium]|nr:hypothetical protein [Gammaproteobacteria bacterium]
MKHAGPEALKHLAPLLKDIRSVPFLNERRPGVFYRKSVAFLHFHEDAEGPFADLRTSGKEFVRYRVKTATEQKSLLKRIVAAGETP